jgi:hypothetical protein
MASRPRLTRDSDFLKLWSGQTVSAFGSMLGALGLTALVYLHATPAEMGLLAMAQGLPVLLFAFRRRLDRPAARRPIMVAADIARAALITVPAAASAGRPDHGAAVRGGLRVGTLALAFDLAYRSYLPGLVEGQGTP